MAIFDLHLVSNDIPRNLLERLFAMGYERRTVVGGDQRVRMSFLLSLKCDTEEETNALFASTADMLSKEPGFSGYLEAEETLRDLSIQSSGGKGEMPPSLAFSPIEAPAGVYKMCDIHATDLRGDVSTRELLLSRGFYFLEMEKQNNRRATVYTMQFARLEDGMQACEELCRFLSQQTNFGGSVKLERTVNLRNYNYVLPPFVQN
jgi:hypothetical protein